MQKLQVNTYGNFKLQSALQVPKFCFIVMKGPQINVTVVQSTTSGFTLEPRLKLKHSFHAAAQNGCGYLQTPIQIHGSLCISLRS